MVSSEELQEIKSRVSVLGKYKAFDSAVSAMILSKDVPALIAEIERLQQFERKAIYTMEENARLRIYEKQIQKLHAAATRVENEETDSFEFGEEVLGILGRLM